MKICNTCKETKPLEEFSFANKVKGTRKNKCKKCTKLYFQQYKESNHDAIKEKWRNASKKYHTTEKRRNKTLRQYGLTEQLYNEMFDKQNGTCLLCPSTATLVVDHCHKTGKIRGLLCNNCNLGLGMFKDDISALENAVKYLQKFAG